MAGKTTTTRFPGVYARECKRRYNGKPDVSYYYTVQQDGKKIWVKCGLKSEGMTANVAAQMRAAALAEKRRTPGLDLRPAKAITFDEAARHYLEHYLPRGGKSCRSWVNRHLLPAFGGMMLSRIDAAAVRILKAELSQKLAPASVRQVLGVLSRIFVVTAKDRLHRLDNPVRDVSMPKVRNARVRYLTQEEAARLLADLEIRAPVWHDLAALSLWTGARLGELLSLRVRSVDLAGSSALVEGKTGRRMIQLNAPARALLQRRMDGKASGDWIFPAESSRNKSGHRCLSHAAFDAACLDLGLNGPETPRESKAVFHSMRHTFASWLAIAGVPLYTISQLMSHSTMKMTQRYAHLCPDTQKSAVELLAGMI
ncbi:MAG: site-specific integrase [Desulfovibrionaceae bacterium]|nr:site-specific integrase [Desulfovibrionaceae bacterium]